MPRMEKRVWIFPLLGCAALAGCRTATPGKAAVEAASTTATRDAATSFNNATNTGSVIAVGGFAASSTPSSGPAVKDVTVCDSAVTWDAPTGGKSDGYTTITGVATETTQLRVCSYAVMNGGTAQDVAFYMGGQNASSSSGNVCGLTSGSQPFMVYHLGPYQVLSRGSGLGVLYSLRTNSGICIHRVSGQSPLGVEVTYTIY